MTDAVHVAEYVLPDPTHNAETEELVSCYMESLKKSVLWKSLKALLTQEGSSVLTFKR